MVLLLLAAVLILVPTRELALQTSQVCKELAKHLNIQIMVTTGGTSLKDDIMRLYQPVHILVGTPGRLVDHIQNTPGLANQLKSVKLFILDEADHMLDMGFRQSLEKIMEVLPSRRQSLLFSATIPKEVVN